jgi:hypothetical protein
MKTLEELLGELTPELRDEVRRYVESLVERESRPRRERLRLTWAGALREFRDRYTALELQKKALEWWGD